MKTIAVGITVHNRNDMAIGNINYWMRMLPPNARLFIVDDASHVPFPGADFRFNENIGIAVAKNKCLELCDYADYIFLADDDVFPRASDWWVPYIESGYNHMCMTFNRKADYVSKDYISYEKPCGCMLFFQRECLEVVGGFDPEFKGYSYEHVNLSQRIFNAGLTPRPFIDVHNSGVYFKSLDYYCEVKSSVSNTDKIVGIAQNSLLLEQKKFSKQFIPYK